MGTAIHCNSAVSSFHVIWTLLTAVYPCTSPWQRQCQRHIQSNCMTQHDEQQQNSITNQTTASTSQIRAHPNRTKQTEQQPLHIITRTSTHAPPLLPSEASKAIVVKHIRVLFQHGRRSYNILLLLITKQLPRWPLHFLHSTHHTQWMRGGSGIRVSGSSSGVCEQLGVVDVVVIEQVGFLG